MGKNLLLLKRWLLRNSKVPHLCSILFRFVEGLSQLVCTTADDVMRLYEDGYQAQNAMKLAPFLIQFTVKILQRPTGRFKVYPAQQSQSICIVASGCILFWPKLSKIFCCRFVFRYSLLIPSFRSSRILRY